MQEGLVGIIGAVWVVAALVLGLLTIMIPVSVYLTQKYTYKCFLSASQND